MTLRKEVKKLPPVVGMMSLIGVMNEDYPVGHGNYMSLSEGPYICNMWAENLKEWVRRNPDSGHIEVTIFHDECYAWRDQSQTVPCSVGIITDSRIPQNWLAPNLHNLCVTGNGWGTVAVGKAIHEHLGLEFTDYCGCEDEYTSPSFIQSFNFESGIRVDTCSNCKKSTQSQYKDPMTEEEKSARDENISKITAKMTIGEAVLDNSRTLPEEPPKKETLLSKIFKKRNRNERNK